MFKCLHIKQANVSDPNRNLDRRQLIGKQTNSRPASGRGPGGETAVNLQTPPRPAPPATTAAVLIDDFLNPRLLGFYSRPEATGTFQPKTKGDNDTILKKLPPSL